MKKIVIALIAGVLGVGAGVAVSNYFYGKVIHEKAGKIDKFRGYYNILNKWFALKSAGKKVEDYFLDKGYENIAVYGMGELGSRFIEDLKDSKIQVAYGIDNKPATAYGEVTVYGVEDELPLADIIVITPIFAFDDIKQTLEKITNIPIVSLEDVIFSL